MKINEYILAIAAIIKKNFKLLIRSKSSALVMILGPLLIVLLVGTAYNTSGLYDINIGVYSNAYSDLSNNLLNVLDDDSFSIKKYESEEKCRNSVMEAESHLCIILPDNMIISNENKNEIIFYADYSRINLVYTIVDILSRRLANKESELSIDLTENLVNKLNEAKEGLSSERSTLDAIITSNDELKGKIETNEEKLNSLDLSSNKTGNFTEIYDEIDNIESSYNLSSSVFDDLKELVEGMESEIDNAYSRLKTASNTVSDSITDLNKIVGNLEEDKKDVIGAKENVNKVIEGFSSLSVTDPNAIATPFTTSIKPISEEKTHLGNLFPAMIVLVVMLISILLSSTVVMNERKARAYFRNFITPVNDYMFVIADFITNLIIVVAQLVIIFLIANYFMKNALFGVLFNFSIIIILIASVFILLGMMLGYAFKTQETATVGSLFVGSVLLFFSNTILPLESMPENIKKFVLFNPFVVSENILRELLIFKLDLGSVFNYIIVLGIFFVSFAAIVVVARYATKRSV